MSLTVGNVKSPYTFSHYNIQAPSFDLGEMSKKAGEFTKDDRVLAYINNILKDSEFQRNPRAYLDAWKERRGTSHILKFPEDVARPFFDMYFPEHVEGLSCIIL